MGIVFLEESTWEELSKLETDEYTAILPTGSYEQHGYHLPINTDSFLVSEIALSAAKRAINLQQDLKILMVPSLNFGISPHHMDFPGSLTLTGDTFIKIIEEICYCLSHHGFRRILLLNGHGGNTDFLKVAARNVRDRIDILIAVTPYWFCAKKEISEIRDSDDGGICHAGEMETSCMLYLKNELVRKGKIKKEMPRPISKFIEIDLLKEGISINHNVIDFSESGTIGDPSLASLAKGKKFLDVIIKAVANFIIDFSRWNFDNLNKKD